MNLKLIKNENDYEEALSEIDVLMDLDPDPGTPESDKLEVLSLIIREYEDAVYPIDMPDPIEAIKFGMEQQGLKQRDLVPFIGSKSKVSELLSGKRPLSLRMIRALHIHLGIPAEILLQERDASSLDETDIGSRRIFESRHLSPRK